MVGWFETSTPFCVSVFYSKTGTRGDATASASQVGQGEWHINRVLVSDQAARGQGLGSEALRRLQRLVADQKGTSLHVTPGGYGMDPRKQRRFYLKNGFRPQEEEREALVWNPTET